MRIVVAPDRFGDTLTAAETARAVDAGWRSVRADDEVATVPLSDGGPGLLDVVATADDTWVTTEVAGPHGHPIDAAWLWRADGTAVVEAARACGRHLTPASPPTPRLATTYGVGQLLDAARERGARRVVVGLGGTATLDAGTGALLGLGYRLTLADGSGLKVGGADLPRVAGATSGWAAAWDDVEVELLADVTTTLSDAPASSGPEVGADPDDVAAVERAFAAWAEIAARDLTGHGDPTQAGSGAGGGLAFGLAAALPHARVSSGGASVAALVGLPDRIARADLVVTGRAVLEATLEDTDVVGAVLATAGSVPVAAVVGHPPFRAPVGPHDVELATPGADLAAEVRAAAARLAVRAGQRSA